MVAFFLVLLFKVQDAFKEWQSLMSWLSFKHFSFLFPDQLRYFWCYSGFQISRRLSGDTGVGINYKVQKHLRFLRRTIASKLSSLFLKRAEISGRETRNSQLLNIPLFKTSTEQRTFYYRTVPLWNSLERSLNLSESLNIFKRRLRGKLLREFLSS